jgi:hypothetical protein
VKVVCLSVAYRAKSSSYVTIERKVRNTLFIARASIVIRNTSLRHDDSGPGSTHYMTVLHATEYRVFELHSALFSISIGICIYLLHT